MKTEIEKALARVDSLANQYADCVEVHKAGKLFQQLEMAKAKAFDLLRAEREAHKENRRLRCPHCGHINSLHDQCFDTAVDHVDQCDQCGEEFAFQIEWVPIFSVLQEVSEPECSECNETYWERREGHD